MVEEKLCLSCSPVEWVLSSCVISALEPAALMCYRNYYGYRFGAAGCGRSWWRSYHDRTATVQSSFRNGSKHKARMCFTWHRLPSLCCFWHVACPCCFLFDVELNDDHGPSCPRCDLARYLKRTIQGSDKGHNSAEDALAALELAQLKVAKGPNFGAERSTESIFDRLHRYALTSDWGASEVNGSRACSQ